VNEGEIKARLSIARALRAEADQVEEEAVRAALEGCGWHVLPASKVLGMTHNSLARLLGLKGNGGARLASLGAEARGRSVERSEARRRERLTRRAGVAAAGKARKEAQGAEG
jgi:hypothetical protein